MIKINHIFLSLLVFGLVSSAFAGDPNAGKIKFNLFCATCHGATGKGDGAAAAGLNPKPRNFQDAAVMSKKSDADLKKVIQQGGAAVGLSPLMPPWSSALTEQEIANVISFIRSLSKGAGK